MENQHSKITGCRELSQQEVDLMNRIEAKGAEMLELQDELRSLLTQAQIDRYNAVDNATTSGVESSANAELERFQSADPFRWAAIGKTDIQTGIMALVRAVAQPAV